MRKIPTEHRDYIVFMFCDELIPMAELADTYGVSRQAIWNILNAAGADTSKGQRVKRYCAWCGKPVERVKSKARGRKRVFCINSDCYFDWMRAGGNLFSLEITRSIVGRYFELGPDMVVHNEDGNRLNNQLRNLRVFGSHEDHMRYHFERSVGGDVTVPMLWDGRTV